jgi:ssDNA-binding Zn-finger/Zn-ribbon topoisomerase 1
MSGAVEHSDIRYVVYPVHLDGTPTGAKPRLRHDPGCGHFESGDGTILSPPQLATEEQMQTLRACKTCIGTRIDSPKDAHHNVKDGRTGGLCPACNQMMPLTGSATTAPPK